MEDIEMKFIFSGDYDEELDKQEFEKYPKEEVEAARSEGMKKGLKEGIEEGIKEGLEIAAKQNAIQTAKKLLKELPEWSDQKIAEIANDISAEDVAELRKGEKLS